MKINIKYLKVWYNCWDIEIANKDTLIKKEYLDNMVQFKKQ